MKGVMHFEPGGYHYIPAVFQYSSGVSAAPGFALEHARFSQPRPVRTALLEVRDYLKSLGRPVQALAQCEVRSPKPFSDEGFDDFNRHYMSLLRELNLFRGDANPIARTNVCPMYHAPEEPSLYAFSFTVPCPEPDSRTFVLAGSGDAYSGAGPFIERRVAPDDTSAEGLHEKVAHVIREMERRMALLGFDWEDVATNQVYTVQNIGHLVGKEIVQRGAAASELIWHYARPPIIGMEYEMDLRRVAREHFL